MHLTLRPGVVWQDGTKLLASDFVKMYGYLSDPALKTDIGVQKMKGLFAPVTAVKAPDPSTVVMEFAAPVPYIYDILDYWYAVRFDNPKNTNFLTKPPVGTGPYKMTRYVQGQNAQFKAFPDYYIKGKPAITNFTFDIFANGSNLISNLRSGLVQGMLVANYGDVKSIQGNSSYYTTESQLGVWNLMVNCSKPPFNNVAVRQALSYSLDRNSISSTAFFGIEKPVTSPFYTPAATGYVADLVHAQSFDLAKAKSLLKSAGVHNLTFTFPSPTSAPNLQTVAEIWQSDLAKIGVKMKIQTIDNGLWYNLGGKKNLDGADVVPWNNGRCLLDGAVFWNTQGNYVPGAASVEGYQNPTMLKLIKQGATAVDPATRKRIYQKLNEIVVRDCYCLSLVTLSNVWAWSSAVKGVTADLAGNLMVANAKLNS